MGIVANITDVKHRKLRLVLLVAVLLAVIAPSLPAEDIEQVSAEIHERLHHTLRPDSGTTAARSFSLPPGLTLGTPLTEEDAVAMALWNNAGLQAALAELGLVQADLIEAGLLVNPDLQMLFGVGSKPFEFLLKAPIEALWQRPRRVAIAKLNLSSVSQALVQNGIDLARDVRLSHAELTTAVARARLLAEEADLTAAIAELTGKRLEAGDISRLDAQLARLEADTVRDRAEQAAREVELANHRLRLLLGLEQDAPPISVTAAPVTREPPGPEEELLEVALSSRPDVRAGELAIEAAGKRVGWERSKLLAFVAPLLSSKEVGSALDLKTGPGLAAPLPVFHRNQGGVTRAEAEVTRASLRYTEMAQQVVYEVRESRVRLLQAQESLRRLRQQIVPEMEEAVRLAEQAYEDGDISFLELQQARRPLLETRLREESAELRVRSAGADLSRAVGRKS